MVKSKNKVKPKTKKYKERQDWKELQRMFEEKKINNSAYTLKEFCKANKLDYGYARVKLNLKKSLQKASFFEDKKNKVFAKEIKKKPKLKVKERLFLILKPFQCLMGYLSILYNRILKK